MFTLPHIYVATKVAKSHHPLLVLGSFLPDVGLLSHTEEEKNFSWNQLHEGGEQLLELAQKSKQPFVPLALGVMTHGVTYGLDKYSDVSYKSGLGYAKIKAIPLYEEVTDCCHVKPETGKIFAHNFIEMAVNLIVARKYPQTIEDLKVTEREIDQNEVANFLADCFRANNKMVLSLIKNLFEIFNPNDLNSANGLAKIWAKIALNLEGVKIDKKRAEKIIKQGVNLVKADYQEFLEESIMMMKKERQWVI